MLVNMPKGGEVIAVHPLCVEEHKRIGWVVGGELPAAPEPIKDEPGEETVSVVGPVKALPSKARKA